MSLSLLNLLGAVVVSKMFTQSKYLVRGCFLRMKYDGDISSGVLLKSNLSVPYKYLAHVMLHCLGPVRGGFDKMRETLQCAMVALVLNRPFNFSEMTFIHLKENMTAKKEKKFVMFPQLLQQIFNVQHPDLPKDQGDVLKLDHMKDETLIRQLTYQN